MNLPGLRDVRRAAAGARRWLFPRPEVAAWRKACRRAEAVPRFTRGRIRLMEYELSYADLLTLCPQWHDLFVRETHRFRSARRPPTILDCGANVGLASLYFKRCYPDARITAFEADPDLHSLLVQNLRANGAADVEAVPAAVWTETGTLEFRCEGADSGSIASLDSGPGGPLRTVPSVRLRDLLAGARVDLLKLDIEGAEVAVLKDCADVLGGVSAILLELHDFDPSRAATEQVLATLRSAGFLLALDDLAPLPWRPPAGQDSAFPSRAPAWSVLVRAWKP